MTNELDRNAFVSIEVFFERKDDENTIRDRADGFQAAPPPGPDLRAHVVHDGDAESLDATRKPKIEVRKIDDDQNRGSRLSGQRHQSTECGKMLRQLRENLSESRHREVAVVRHEVTAGFDELRS